MGTLRATTKKNGLTGFKSIARGSGSTKGNVVYQYLFVAPVHADRSGFMVSDLPATWHFKVEFIKRRSKYYGFACTVRIIIKKSKADGRGREMDTVYIKFKDMKYGRKFLANIRKRLNNASWTTMGDMQSLVGKMKRGSTRPKGGTVD